jgi:hypothetical protein
VEVAAAGRGVERLDAAAMHDELRILDEVHAAKGTNSLRHVSGGEWTDVDAQVVRRTAPRDKNAGHGVPGWEWAPSNQPERAGLRATKVPRYKALATVWFTGTRLNALSLALRAKEAFSL